ncbi:uncharacterized protein LOC129597972 [Paramacrobiotus metropolitanus]|uniref:uncharacterized protein LOC129597972 n=1 Tax=Paramacrobiotus metropolitanus TaxID=2943436 RepID=UPI00244588B3|nr:uncharacterized protein LOC129597972 [Paramacrobiotus metropolitanus]
MDSYSPISSPSPPGTTPPSPNLSPVLSASESPAPFSFTLSTPNVSPALFDSPESPPPENTTTYFSQQPQPYYSTAVVGTHHHQMESQLLNLQRLTARILNGPTEMRLTGVLNLRVAYHYDSVGNDFVENWKQFLNQLMKLYQGDNEKYYDQIKSWEKPFKINKTNIQTTVVTLENACGLICLNIVSRIVLNFCIFKICDRSCIDLAVNDFMTWYHAIKQAEGSHAVDEPKRLCTLFVAQAGLGCYKTSWEVGRYEGIRLSLVSF